MKKVAFFLIIGVFLLSSFINEIPFSYSSPNQPNNNSVGYELIDSNQVLHIWNVEDDYYFNATSGMQFTNHYEDYWSKNIFCGGYYNAGIWNKLVCVDELPFSWSIETDNENYVNVTGYKDISYLAYDLRVALRYSLEKWDTRLTIIPYIKNIGDENILFDLGFAWNIRNIQIDMEEEDNVLEVYDLEDGFYGGINLNGLNAQNTSNIDAIWIKNNNTAENIFLDWNESLNYALQVAEVAGQYNSPITLFIKIGGLEIGQEKKTEIFWIDANPYCEYVGTDGDEDVCFVEEFTALNWTNYSDALSISENPTLLPRFKVTHSESMPVSCSWSCRLYKNESGTWYTMDIWNDAACYNNWATSASFCSGGATPGYCWLNHTRAEFNLVDWDLCILYSGASCAEDGNNYCGLGHLGGGLNTNRGDAREGMAMNEHTPYTEYLTTNDSLIEDYQEDSNNSEEAGTWIAGHFAKTIDGNWGTNGYAPAGLTGYGFVNYTKQCNFQQNVYWEVKDGCATANLTLPLNCTEEEDIQLRFTSERNPNNVYWHCWDTAGWELLRTCAGNPQVYEEGIYWNNSYVSASYVFYDLDDYRGDKEGNSSYLWYIDGTYNSSFDNIKNIANCSLCGGNFTYEVLAIDDSYFSPTGNEVWNETTTGIWFSACAEVLNYSFKIALILSFFLCSLCLIFVAFVLDNEHYPIKVLLFGFSLYLFMLTFQIADAVLNDVSGVSLNVYVSQQSMMWGTFTFIVVIIIIFVQRLFRAFIDKREKVLTKS